MSTKPDVVGMAVLLAINNVTCAMIGALLAVAFG